MTAVSLELAIRRHAGWGRDIESLVSVDVWRLRLGRLVVTARRAKP